MQTAGGCSNFKRLFILSASSETEAEVVAEFLTVLVDSEVLRACHLFAKVSGSLGEEPSAGDQKRLMGEEEGWCLGGVR